MSHSTPFVLTPYLRSLIRAKAERLVGQHGFRRHDRDDLEQDLTVHALVASARYNPGLGAPASYYNRVLVRKAIDLALRNTRQKRDRRSERPVDEAEQLAVPGNLFAATDLRLDVGEALACLSADDRAVARCLADESVADATRITGHSRQSVRSARGRVRRHLEKCGVGR